jgi:hypothetical protein
VGNFLQSLILKLMGFSDLRSKIDTILTKLDMLTALEMEIMTDLTALTAQVKANTDVENSAVILIQGIAAQLASVAADPAAVAALAAQLKTSADALAAAVAANTPVAPSA